MVHRKILVPDSPPLVRLPCGWAVYEYPNYSSPLWVNLKLINYVNLHKRRRRGVYRTAWVSWSVDAARLANSSGCARLRAAAPQLLDELQTWCRTQFTEATVTARHGSAAIAAARRAEAERRAAKPASTPRTLNDLM